MAKAPAAKASPATSRGACVCGVVMLEIDTPAVWAWHDHSAASRHAQGCAYATYVGSWRSRLRILAGEAHITRFEDKAAGTVRSFCDRCGTPIFAVRAGAGEAEDGEIFPALFVERTGREPRAITSIWSEAADWTWQGEALIPLQGLSRRDVAPATQGETRQGGEGSDVRAMSRGPSRFQRG